MTSPRLSAVMIARAAQANVARCFSSLWDACSEVILCDTGSLDGTVAVAEAFAEARDEREKLIVGHFDWCDSYAAARNYADTLASSEWLINVDLDETVDGADALRDLAASASPDTVAFAFWTVFTVPPHSERVGLRLARSGAAAWQGDLHEHRMFETGEGEVVLVEDVRIVNHRVETDYSVRDLRLVRGRPGELLRRAEVAMWWMKQRAVGRPRTDKFRNYFRGLIEGPPRDGPDARSEADPGGVSR